MEPNLNNFKITYAKAIFTYEEYRAYCVELKNKLNKKFKTKIVEDIFYQPSDGLVILSKDGMNIPININEIAQLKTLIEFKEYLKNNRI